MKYQVIHKLTGKPVRNTNTLEIMTFDDEESAQKLADTKNTIMGAVWYVVAEVLK